MCVRIKGACGARRCRGCGPGQRPWERPDQARGRRAWLLPRQLECISLSSKCSGRILMIFLLISIFLLHLSSLVLPCLPSARPPFSPPPLPLILESDCLLCELAVPSSSLSTSSSCNSTMSHSLILHLCQSLPLTGLFARSFIRVLFTFPSFQLLSNSFFSNKERDQRERGNMLKGDASFFSKNLILRDGYAE